MNRTESQEQIFNDSGKISSTDPLVSFLYTLMRDYITPGKVENIMQDVAKVECTFTNGWLAQYAEYIAKRLK